MQEMKVAVQPLTL